MAYGLNKVQIIGHLGQDPEIRVTKSGTTAANLSVATDESYKDKSGALVEKTAWHRVAAFAGLAEIMERYLQKGSKVYIEGKLHTRSYVDKEGVKRYVTEIKAGELLMLKGTRGADDGADDGATRARGDGQRGEAPAQPVPAGGDAEGDFEPDPSMPF